MRDMVETVTKAIKQIMLISNEQFWQAGGHTRLLLLHVSLACSHIASQPPCCYIVSQCASGKNASTYGTSLAHIHRTATAKENPQRFPSVILQSLQRFNFKYDSFFLNAKSRAIKFIALMPCSKMVLGLNPSLGICM